MSKAEIDERVTDPEAGPPVAVEEDEAELRELASRLDRLQASMDLWGQTPEQTVTAPAKHARGGPGAVIMFVGSILFIIGSVAGIFFRDQLPAFLPVSFQRMEAEPGTPDQYMSDPYEREFVPAKLQPTPPVPPVPHSVVAEPPATGADAVAEVEKKVTQTNLASAQIHPVGPFLMGRSIVPPMPPSMPEPPPAKVEDAPPLPEAPEPELPVPAAPDPEPVALPSSEMTEDRGITRTKPTSVMPRAIPAPPVMTGRPAVSRRAQAVAAKPAPAPAPEPAKAPKTTEPGTVQPVNGYVGL